MITEEQLKQFEKLLEGTTPGEWTTKQTKHLFGDGSPVFQVLSKTNHKGVTRQDGGWYVIGELFGDTDAIFTAIAHSAFPVLIEAYKEKDEYLQLNAEINAKNIVQLGKQAILIDKLRGHLEAIRDYVIHPSKVNALDMTDIQKLYGCLTQAEAGLTEAERTP